VHVQSVDSHTRGRGLPSMAHSRVKVRTCACVYVSTRAGSVSPIQHIITAALCERPPHRLCGEGQCAQRWSGANKSKIGHSALVGLVSKHPHHK
jgi:hypothetical protein